MQLNQLKKYQFLSQASSNAGASILNQPYGIAWASDSINGRSAKSIYDKIQTIGAGFGNTAFVRTGGNDATGIVGNYLSPFATPGAAIAAIGLLPNSLLSVDAGSYVLNDGNAPYGLKSPNSSYDVILSPGAVIEYYGTYGLWVANSNTTGSLYGYGRLRAYNNTFSGAVDGVSNFAINIGVNATPVYFEAVEISNNATGNLSGLFRVGSCISTSVRLNILERMIVRGGWGLSLDVASRLDCIGITFFSSTSQNNGLILINNPTEIYLNNIKRSQAYGYAFGRTQAIAVDITNTANSTITFFQCNIIALDSNNVNYKLININGGAPAIMNNFTIRDCILKNRYSTAYIAGGVSLSANFNTSIKIIDTYAERTTGGGVITNLISAGNGFMVDTNL